MITHSCALLLLEAAGFTRGDDGVEGGDVIHTATRRAIGVRWHVDQDGRVGWVSRLGDSFQYGARGMDGWMFLYRATKQVVSRDGLYLTLSDHFVSRHGRTLRIETWLEAWRENSAGAVHGKVLGDWGDREVIAMARSVFDDGLPAEGLIDFLKEHRGLP